MIRDMLMLRGGNLIVATDAGMVQRIPLCDSCLSDAALAKIAASHLHRASQLGLAVRKTIPNPSHAQRRH
jgi:hypothetical protein